MTLQDGPQGAGDGLYGVTAFPSALAVAASWDLDLMFAFGQAVGLEQFKKGVNVMLGPGTNLARVPFNGRLWEYYSEDPLLSAGMVSNYVRGAQTNNISTCVKHYLANSQEFNRNNEDAEIPERALHELYFYAFRAAAAAGAGGVGAGRILVVEESRGS